MTIQSFRVGDAVTAENVDEVPEWTCVQGSSEDHIWRRVGDRWQTVGFSITVPSDPLRKASGDGSVVAVERCIVGLRCAATTRADLGRELAAQGWAPAVEWLRRHGLNTPSPVAPSDGACADDPFVQSTAALFEPVPKVGDLLTNEQIAALPVGAVTYQSKVPNPVFIYRKTASGWDAAWLDWDPTLSLSPRNPDHGPPAGVQLIALGCDAPSRAGLMRQLAESGHEAAREWMREHADHPLVRAPEPAPLHLSVTAETGAAQDALGHLADEMAALAPPLPAVGEVVTPEMLDRLPVGAVVDTRDGSNTPWAIKCEDGWDYIGRGVLLGGRWFEASGMRTALPRWRPTLVALDAPSQPGEALRAWCVERGYKRAIAVERELTDLQVRKQIIDERNAPPQNQDMATSATHITTSTGTYIQRPEENAPAFLARIAAGGAPDVQSTSQRASQPLALTRFVDACKGIGADFAKDGVKAVVDSKALVLVDGGRLALHGAAAQIAEWVGGESAVEKVQRATQNPLAAGIEDVLVVIGATLTGQQGLAAAVRGRVVRRIVDGAEGAIVAKGAAVVTQLAQAAKALGAASAAAELPAESTATQTEGEVQS